MLGRIATRARGEANTPTTKSDCTKTVAVGRLAQPGGSGGAARCQHSHRQTLMRVHAAAECGRNLPSNPNHKIARTWWTCVLPVVYLSGCVGVFLLLVSALRHEMAGVVIDDAYISFRYAQNLASGNGLVFNVGERVEGYTNFLWCILVAALIRLGVEPVHGAQLLGILSGAFLLLLAYGLAVLCVEETNGYALLPPFLIASTPFFAYLSLSGLETLLFMALLFAAALCYLYGERQPAYLWLSALFFALAALTRLEGAMFFAVTCVYSVILRPMKKSEGALVVRLWPWVFLLFFLPYFAWRWRYYGDLLPNTFYNKVGLGFAQVERGIDYLGEVVRTSGLTALLPLTLLAFLAHRTCKLARTYLGTLAISNLAYVVSVGGDSFGVRLLLPTVALCCVFCAAGVADVERYLAGWRVRVPAGIAAAVFLAGWGLVGPPYLLLERGGMLAGVAATSFAQRSWIEVGKWLRANASEDAVLAVDCAGAIPFYSGLPTIDMLGLNDRHIAHLQMPNLGAGTPGHEKQDPAYVLAKQPEYIATWLDEDGSPGWGLGGWLEVGNYDLVLLSLQDNTALGAQRLKPVVLPYSDYALDREKGYKYGIFRRRDGLLPGMIEYDARSPYLKSANGVRVRDTLATHGWALCTGGGEPGMLVFGPYKRSREGRYEVAFRLKGLAPSSGDVAAVVDVAATQPDGVSEPRILARRVIYGDDLPGSERYRDFPLSFEVDTATARDIVELRVEGRAGCSLCFDRVVVQTFPP